MGDSCLFLPRQAGRVRELQGTLWPTKGEPDGKEAMQGRVEELLSDEPEGLDISSGL